MKYNIEILRMIKDAALADNHRLVDAMSVNREMAGD